MKKLIAIAFAGLLTLPVISSANDLDNNIKILSY